MNQRSRGWRAIALVVLVGAFWGTAANDAFPGDAVVARTLLESGKKALTAKKYDEAIPLFTKAFSEDPTLVEAVYWRAQVREKMKDDGAALADYRVFIDAYAKKVGPSADDAKLKALADKRVDALAVSDKEFRKLEEKYVADLLAVAKAKVAGDPGAALSAVNRVLEVQPKNAEALALRDRLGEKKADNPFDGVASWRDIVKEKGLHSEVVKYADDVMSINIKTGGKIRPEPPATLGTDYAGEMEFRVVSAFETNWGVGFSMGETKDGYFATTVGKAEVKVLYGKPKEKPSGVASVATAPVDTSAWHKLAFVVHQNQIQVFVDGEKVIDECAAQKSDFAGEIGVTVAAVNVEFRSVRFGSFK